MRVIFLVALTVVRLLPASPPFQEDLERAGPSQLSRAVAHALYEGAFDPSPDYFSGLIAGMESAASASPTTRDPWGARLAWMQADFERRKKANLIEVEQHFLQLSSRPDLISIEPGDLYYQTLKPGTGMALPATAATVTAHIEVEPLNSTREKALASYNSYTTATTQTYPLSELLPGLAHGMVGMEAGETRLIYIHPDYAYGDRSAFEPAVAFVARVQLLGYIEGETPLPALERRQAPPSYGPSEAPSRCMYEVGLADGLVVWDHLLKGSNLYSLDQIVTALSDLVEAPEPLSPDNIDLFSKLQCYLHSSRSDSNVSSALEKRRKETAMQTKSVGVR